MGGRGVGGEEEGWGAKKTLAPLVLPPLLPVQYTLRIVRVGGCPAVVAQWQSTGASSQSCLRFDSWIPAFHFPLFSPQNI